MPRAVHTACTTRTWFTTCVPHYTTTTPTLHAVYPLRLHTGLYARWLRLLPSTTVRYTLHYTRYCAHTYLPLRFASTAHYLHPRFSHTPSTRPVALRCRCWTTTRSVPPPFWLLPGSTRCVRFGGLPLCYRRAVHGTHRCLPPTPRITPLHLPPVSPTPRHFYSLTPYTVCAPRLPTGLPTRSTHHALPSTPTGSPHAYRGSFHLPIAALNAQTLRFTVLRFTVASVLPYGLPPPLTAPHRPTHHHSPTSHLPATTCPHHLLGSRHLLPYGSSYAFSPVRHYCSSRNTALRWREPDNRQDKLLRTFRTQRTCLLPYL